MTRTRSMQLAKIQTTGILGVEWPAGMEGNLGIIRSVSGRSALKKGERDGG